MFSSPKKFISNRKKQYVQRIQLIRTFLPYLPTTQQYFLACFSQQSLRLKIRRQTKSYELVLSFVGAGEGYLIMITRPATKRAYNDNGLAYIPSPDEMPPAQIGITVTKQTSPTRLIRKFFNVCRKTFLQEKLPINISCG